MSQIGRLLLILGSAAASGAIAGAQTPCAATVRELSVLTPRMQLHDLTLPNAPVADIVASGDECTADTLGTVRRSVRMFRAGIIDPTFRLRSQGGLPDPRDEGDVWTGRGTSIFIRGGLSFDAGLFHAVFAPELSVAQNTAFDFLVGTDTSRSSFASAFYTGPFSIDLPTRMGTGWLTLLSLGQSAMWVSHNEFDIGLSASSQHWGPGEEGGLLLGPDAPGIPRAFVRTARPIETEHGAWTLSAFLGTLTESRFFDHDPGNDNRTMFAALASWSPSVVSPFAFGFSHGDIQLGTPFVPHQPLRGSFEQMNTLFARVRSPDAGVRAWFELGRPGGLPALRQLVTVPYGGISYLVGLERAVKYRPGTLLLSTELANLEQTVDIRGVPSQDLYTSGNVPQGFTQRGQVLGYATGPGSQSEHAAADWVASRWSAGLFADRVRWNEDALFRQYLAYPNRHDVSVSAGLRAALRVRGQEVALQASTGRRINYEFQNNFFIPGYRTVDVRIPQLTFSVTPAPFTVK
jgi:hypothetical protein